MEEHQSFQQSHTQCMDAVETLRRRLAVCGDLAGDKQDVQVCQVICLVVVCIDWKIILTISNFTEYFCALFECRINVGFILHPNNFTDLD